MSFTLFRTTHLVGRPFPHRSSFNFSRIKVNPCGLSLSFPHLLIESLLDMVIGLDFFCVVLDLCSLIGITSFSPFSYPLFFSLILQALHVCVEIILFLNYDDWLLHLSPVHAALGLFPPSFFPRFWNDRENPPLFARDLVALEVSLFFGRSFGGFPLSLPTSLRLFIDVSYKGYDFLTSSTFVMFATICFFFCLLLLLRVAVSTGPDSHIACFSSRFELDVRCCSFLTQVTKLQVSFPFRTDVFRVLFLQNDIAYMFFYTLFPFRIAALFLPHWIVLFC